MSLAIPIIGTSTQILFRPCGTSARLSFLQAVTPALTISISKRYHICKSFLVEHSPQVNNIRIKLFHQETPLPTPKPMSTRQLHLRHMNPSVLLILKLHHRLCLPLLPYPLGFRKIRPPINLTLLQSPLAASSHTKPFTYFTTQMDGTATAQCPHPFTSTSLNPSKALFAERADTSGQMGSYVFRESANYSSFCHHVTPNAASCDDSRLDTRSSLFSRREYSRSPSPH